MRCQGNHDGELDMYSFLLSIPCQLDLLLHILVIGGAITICQVKAAKTVETRFERALVYKVLRILSLE